MYFVLVHECTKIEKEKKKDFFLSQWDLKWWQKWKMNVVSRKLFTCGHNVYFIVGIVSQREKCVRHWTIYTKKKSSLNFMLEWNYVMVFYVFKKKYSKSFFLMQLYVCGAKTNVFYIKSRSLVVFLRVKTQKKH